jgi:hypothetical protein
MQSATSKGGAETQSAIARGQSARPIAARSSRAPTEIVTSEASSVRSMASAPSTLSCSTTTRQGPSAIWAKGGTARPGHRTP